MKRGGRPYTYSCLMVFECILSTPLDKFNRFGSSQAIRPDTVCITCIYVYFWLITSISLRPIIAATSKSLLNNCDYCHCVFDTQSFLYMYMRFLSIYTGIYKQSWTFGSIANVNDKQRALETYIVRLKSGCFNTPVLAVYMYRTV